MNHSTKEEALELVTARLNKNSTDTRWFHILKERTIEKPFGWVFFYEVMTSCGGSISSGPAQIIRPVIINKHSQQVIGNSRDKWRDKWGQIFIIHKSTEPIIYPKFLFLKKLLNSPDNILQCTDKHRRSIQRLSSFKPKPQFYSMCPVNNVDIIERFHMVAGETDGHYRTVL